MLGSQREYKEGSSHSMPAISFNKGQLMEIIECFPEGAPQENLVSRLNDIETQVTKIRKNQSMKEIADAVSKIENHAKDIFAENKKYDQVMANTLKTMIFKFIKPIQEIVEAESLKNDPNDFVELREHKLTAEELEFRKRLLYAEQSFIARQPAVHQMLINYLNQIKKLLIPDSKTFSPRCYLVFVEPARENKSKENWVVPFLSVLNEHLKAVGIQVGKGMNELSPGENFFRFLEQYKDNSDIIFLGTNSTINYFKGSESSYEHLMLSALLRKKLEKQNESGIYPLLISGTPKTAFPDVFGYDSSTVANAYSGYIATLKLLTDFLFRKNRVGHRVKYEKIWKQLIEKIQKLPENNDAVTREINEGFHTDYRVKFIKTDVEGLCKQAQEIQIEEPQVKSFSSFSPDFFNPNSPKKPKTITVSAQVNFDEVKAGAPGGPNFPEDVEDVVQKVEVEGGSLVQKFQT